MGERLYIVDGSAYAYRAYYAVKGLSTSAGQATNAVYGFITTLLKILEERSPDHLVVAFDVPGCREVVKDEENGYLVQTLNAKALAEAVLKLLEDPKRAQLMGKKAREQTVKYFDDAQIYSKILGVYSHAGFGEI